MSDKYAVVTATECNDFHALLNSYYQQGYRVVGSVATNTTSGGYITRYTVIMEKAS
jgi:hypothetical protein